MAPAPVIGIVGGIGSGKSRVAAELVRHGGYLIAADRLGHEALRQPVIKNQVVARWGGAVLDPAGEIDRRQLGQIVFAATPELRALEAITHPYIEERIREEIAKARLRPDVQIIVLDAAVMLEAGWHHVCDHLVFVDAPQETRLQRLRDARNWDVRDLENRENAQLPLAEKRRQAGAVIVNDGDPSLIALRVGELLARWGL